MHILILKKKFIYIFLSIFILTLIISYFIYIYNSPSIAVEINSNSFSSLNFSNINNITKSKEKFAYLTFDDGPTTKATSKILDILKAEDVKATFFVVGKLVKENPDLVKREYQEGHYIANHGYNHNNKLLYSSMENFKNEVVNTDTEISKAIGIDNYSSHIFRFPNGYMSKKYSAQKKNALNVLSDLNYSYVDWNCLNKDSEKKYSNSQLLNNLKKTAKNKGTLVVLMHDTADVNKTYDVLEDSIKYLKSQGYTFKNFYDINEMK